MTARDDLLYEMTHNHLYMDDSQANAKINAFIDQLVEHIMEAAGPAALLPGELKIPDASAGMHAAAGLIESFKVT